MFAQKTKSEHLNIWISRGGHGMPGTPVPGPLKKLNLGLALGAGCRYKFVQTITQTETTQMAATRKSTQKHEVFCTMTGLVLLTGVSRTDAEGFRRAMKNKNLFIRPVRRGA